MDIIADTNALIYAIKHKVDLSNLPILVPNLVLDELTSLTKTARKTEDREAAKLALKVFNHDKLPLFLPKGHTDTEIIKYCKKNKAAILTNDLKLRKLADAEGIKIFVLRQKSKVEEI